MKAKPEVEKFYLVEGVVLNRLEQAINILYSYGLSPSRLMKEDVRISGHKVEDFREMGKILESVFTDGNIEEFTEVKK